MPGENSRFRQTYNTYSQTRDAPERPERPEPRGSGGLCWPQNTVLSPGADSALVEFEYLRKKQELGGMVQVVIWQPYAYPATIGP
jgi:hypothetical protein